MEDLKGNQTLPIDLTKCNDTSKFIRKMSQRFILSYLDNELIIKPVNTPSCLPIKIANTIIISSQQIVGAAPKKFKPAHKTSGSFSGYSTCSNSETTKLVQEHAGAAPEKFGIAGVSAGEAAEELEIDNESSESSFAGVSAGEAAEELEIDNESSESSIESDEPHEKNWVIIEEVVTSLDEDTLPDFNKKIQKRRAVKDDQSTNLCLDDDQKVVVPDLESVDNLFDELPELDESQDPVGI